MRILFASTHPHLPEVRGGLQTTTHDLCLAIQDAGGTVAVLCGVEDPAAAPGLAWQSDDRLGYTVMRAPDPARAIARVARAWKPDAIVVQSGPALRSLLIASLDTGRPTAAYLHNVELHQVDGTLVPDPAVLYLANSSFSAQRWRDLCGLECRVVPPVVRLEETPAPSTGDRVLFVNPVPVKGVERFFALAAACPELRFLVVENWYLYPSWREYCKRRAAHLGNVEWLEPTGNMREVYARARVLLMPSVWEEAFGRTVVEAQAHGIPVLASRRGALPEVVGEGGIVLDSCADEDWAVALRALHAEPGRWSAPARARAAAHVAATQVIVADLLAALVEHGLRVGESAAAVPLARRLLEQGWSAQLRGDRLAAIEDYRDGLRQASDAGLARRLALHLARALADAGRLDEALEGLAQAIEAFPDEPRLRIDRCWLRRAAGDHSAALREAREISSQPGALPDAWFVLAVLQDDDGEHARARQAYEKVVALDPHHVEAMSRLAALSRDRGDRAAARRWMDTALAVPAPSLEARVALAKALLDDGRLEEARREALRSLRREGASAEFGCILAAIHVRRGRPRAAVRWANGALRLGPEDPEALRIGAWVALETGDRAAALDRARRLAGAERGGAAGLSTAAAVLDACGATEEAARCAERAVSRHPKSAEAWRALASVRRAQSRIADAEQAAMRALALDDSGEGWRQLGAILLRDQRASSARDAFRNAADRAPGDAETWLDLAGAHASCGEAVEALAALDRAEALQPGRMEASGRRALVWAEGGATAAGDPRRALDECLRLLRRDPASAPALDDCLRLLDLGTDVSAALDIASRDALRQAFRRAVANAIHRRGLASLRRLVHAAIEAHPGDAWFATAAFYALSLDGAAGEVLHRRAREWSRSFRVRVTGKANAMPLPTLPDPRPRIAYVASQQHFRLLKRVLAAHDAAAAEVFLYSREPWPDAPEGIRVRPLAPDALADAFAADAIDVAIDTGGVHPFEGQYEVLQAFARRLAPVQAGWIGTLSHSGGLFDVLIADDVSVPPGSEAAYEERIVRIEGGQWCWDPPEQAPDPGAPPFERRGFVTFGVSARSLRLDDPVIEAWARIVAATPEARIAFCGAVSQDWPLQRAIREAMARHGVGAERVAFEPWRPRARHLAWLAEVDVLLDPFPSGSGLGVPDALWMGVPVVTLAGAHPGARQAASILAAIGRAHWIARDLGGYEVAASRLAQDPESLRECRASLRGATLRSPLTDGRRIAARIEAFCRSVKPHCDAVRRSPDPKAAARVQAAWELDVWLERGDAAIRLPHPPADAAVDLSVVIVLYNQGGLTRRALRALADQDGPAFETIVVDNASTDRTPELLARVHGAHVVRNADNAGFLRAANAGAARARGRHLVFLNNDTVLHPGALAAACAALDRDPSVGVVGGRIVLGDGTLQEAGNRVFRDGTTLGIGRAEDPFCAAAQAARTTDFCSGAFLATPRAAWERLGGFDDAYAPAYFEDADYCLRCWGAGLRVLFEPRILLEHLEWGSAVEGEAARLLLANRARFAERHAAFLAGQPRARRERLDGDRWRSPDDRPRRARVLVLDDAVPLASRGGGLPRARMMLQALEGWPVTLLPLWTFDDTLEEAYCSVPRSVEIALGIGLPGLEAFLERRRGVYDTLLVSRPTNLRAIAPLRQRRPELFEGLRMVYDAEALFASREIAQAAAKGRPLPSDEAQARIASEVALARDASEVIVVSALDEAEFRAAGARTRVLAHATAVRRDAPGPGRREGLLFVGALHPGTPNEDGLLWFLDEVLPRLQGLPADARRLTVIGRCTSERLARRAGADVRFEGTLPTLGEAYDAARIFVAPVRFAAGVPLKVIEAGSEGIPVVASALLARQLGWNREEALPGARDAADFARQIQRLATDDAAWRRQQAAALDECAGRYDFGLFARALREALSVTR